MYINKLFYVVYMSKGFYKVIVTIILLMNVFSEKKKIYSLQQDAQFSIKFGKD